MNRVPQAGGRCRSFIDRRTGRSHRQRQSPAALRQRGGAAPISSASARSTLSYGRRGGGPVHRYRRRANTGHCGLERARCRGGCLARRGGSRGPGRAIISKRCALRRAAPGDTVAAVLAPDSVLIPALVAAARGCGAEYRGGGWHRPACSGACWPRRSAAARRPAGRCWRSDGLSESLVDPALSVLSAPRRRGALRRPAEGARLRERPRQRALYSMTTRLCCGPRTA